MNGTIEVAGPERFHLDELVRQVLKAAGDGREIITDGEARYFGAHLDERTLTPEAPALVGTMHFAEWMKSAASRPPAQGRASR